MVKIVFTWKIIEQTTVLNELLKYLVSQILVGGIYLGGAFLIELSIVSLGIRMSPQ